MLLRLLRHGGQQLSQLGLSKLLVFLGHPHGLGLELIALRYGCFYPLVARLCYRT